MHSKCGYLAGPRLTHKGMQSRRGSGLQEKKVRWQPDGLKTDASLSKLDRS